MSKQKLKKLLAWTILIRLKIFFKSSDALRLEVISFASVLIIKIIKTKNIHFSLSSYLLMDTWPPKESPKNKQNGRRCIGLFFLAPKVRGAETNRWKNTTHCPKNRRCKKHPY
jgi:hypothetical protein